MSSDESIDPRIARALEHLERRGILTRAQYKQLMAPLRRIRSGEWDAERKEFFDLVFDESPSNEKSKAYDAKAAKAEEDDLERKSLEAAMERAMIERAERNRES